MPDAPPGIVEHGEPPIVGEGLTPGDASSVLPNGMPTGPTGELGVMPSGVVAATPGVVPATCAKAPDPALIATRAAMTK
jgi:hypothetical protein